MLVNKFEYVNNSEAKEKCNLFREIFVEQLPQFKTEIYRCSEINMQLIMDTLTVFHILMINIKLCRNLLRQKKN